MSSLESRKLAFLKRTGVNDKAEALTETWKATVKRNPTYNAGVCRSRRLQLGDAVKWELGNLESAYRHVVPAALHLNYILAISQAIECKFSPILQGRRFRIGAAQKALNLYAKYLWCLDLAPEPPHCPLDNIILGKAGINAAWTKLDCPREYLDWINRLAHFTAPRSIADWELENW